MCVHVHMRVGMCTQITDTPLQQSFATFVFPLPRSVAYSQVRAFSSCRMRHPIKKIRHKSSSVSALTYLHDFMHACHKGSLPSTKSSCQFSSLSCTSLSLLAYAYNRHMYCIVDQCRVSAHEANNHNISCGIVFFST